MNSNDQIIKIIDDKRKEKGYSLAQLAKKTGLAKSSLSRYFNKSREFPVNKADVFAKALGLSTNEILGIEEKTTTPTADLADDDVLFTYQGKEIPKSDMNYVRELLKRFDDSHE